MANITSGPSWRRYCYNKGWKVALLCLVVAAPIVYSVHLSKHDASETVRVESFKVFGDLIAGFFILIAALSGLTGREVFVDAGGFVRVRKKFAGAVTGEETIDLSRIDHVTAKMQKVGQGYVAVPTLVLSYSAGPYNDGIVLSTFSNKSVLKEEARSLGALINKPVYVSPEVY